MKPVSQILKGKASLIIFLRQLFTLNNLAKLVNEIIQSLSSWFLCTYHMLPARHEMNRCMYLNNWDEVSFFHSYTRLSCPWYYFISLFSTEATTRDNLVVFPANGEQKSYDSYNEMFLMQTHFCIFMPDSTFKWLLE